MPTLSLERLLEYRSQTFYTAPGLQVLNIEQAVNFVNQRAFIFFWPIKDIVLPSLWVAANGDRPVPDEHDDPGHRTWDWKDSLLGKQRWYYARTLRRRNTMISLEALPYFYALSPNYGDYENDYLDQYEAGQLTQESRLIYEALLTEGPLDTLDLRRVTHMQSNTSSTRFNRALDDLQIQFKILPVGISQAGAWHYAFIYDITARHMPGLSAAAGAITENQARYYLLEKYFLSVGAARRSDISKLFKWRPEDNLRCIESLLQKCAITDNIELSNSKDEWLALSELT
ncbi:MAG: winged helix DNA-binding domain-containing protein [Anaerolineae bacterium]|nr:winged helix DNA-binding domain-containing protein [Anaerolineae bacterium]